MADQVSMDAYLAGLAFWIALQTRDAPEEADVCDALLQEHGALEIIRGLALVCSRLRHELQDHGLLDHARGCDCGTDEWLERLRLEAVAKFG